jgi:hypothetical protein
LTAGLPSVAERRGNLAEFGSLCLDTFRASHMPSTEETGQAETLRPGASHCGIYSALITSSLVDLRLLAQNHVQQGTVDFNVAVVINKTQFTKSVKEKSHAR